MRVDQDVFVFQVPKKRGFFDRTTPTLLRIHAYARTRVHPIISRALREALHPSCRLALAPAPSCSLPRQIFISRAPAAPLWNPRRPLLLRLIPKRDVIFYLRCLRILSFSLLNVVSLNLEFFS